MKIQKNVPIEFSKQILIQNFLCASTQGFRCEKDLASVIQETWPSTEDTIVPELEQFASSSLAFIFLGTKASF
jgi:hypothetical protein